MKLVLMIFIVAYSGDQNSGFFRCKLTDRTHLVAMCDKQEVPRKYFNPDPHGEGEINPTKAEHSLDDIALCIPQIESAEYVFRSKILQPQKRQTQHMHILEDTH